MNFDIEIQNNGRGYMACTEKVSDKDNIMIISVKLNFGKKLIPEKTVLRIGTDMTDMFSTWSPLIYYRRGLQSDMNKSVQESRTAFGAPIKTILSADGSNRLTVAAADCKTPLRILSGIREEDAKIYIETEFFSNPISAAESYETLIRLDYRSIPYYDAIYDTRSWWFETNGLKTAYVPEIAKNPMYSTWYSYHQRFDADSIVKECKKAKELGLDAIIIDDGWQTKDLHRGYAFCGDWKAEPEKVGKMREFVERIHNEGLKVILWYSVPFIGKNSAAWEKFRGKYLDSEENSWCRLDPRFPEVRQYLTEMYKKAAQEWQLDGFKLDFIDSFALFSESMENREGQDIFSLEEAVECLLENIMTELKKINPEICIEFRQSYMGPIMQTYGNMIRVSDCPGDALTNRIGSIDLRLTSGSCAVHSDMLMWNMTDSVQSAARQLINVLFSVPQISVRLNEIPNEHWKMLKFYIKFLRENRDILLDGKLMPLNPEENYPLVCASLDGREIAVLYGAEIYVCGNPESKVTLINCGGKDSAYIDFGKARADEITIYDCMGNIVNRYFAETDGIIKLSVPVCGMAVIS